LKLATNLNQKKIYLQIPITKSHKVKTKKVDQSNLTKKSQSKQICIVKRKRKEKEKIQKK
jgi:hypothetical protein